MKARKSGLLAGTIIGVVLVIIGFVISFKVLPDIVDDRVASSVELGISDQYARFMKLPFGLDFKIYFWNVENPEDVMKGETPVVEEVGPLWYTKTPEKRNVIHDGDTITYEQIKVHKYDKERSKINPDTTVTVLNVPLNAAFQILEGVNLDFLNEALDLGYKEAFNVPEDQDTYFHEIRVGDYSFDGYKFCNPAKTVSSASRFVCALIRIMSASASMEVQADRTITFSFFNHKDRIPDGLYKIHSGSDDAKKVGEIIEWNNKSYLKTWAGGPESKCNKVKGTDSTIYAPYSDEDSVFTVFNTDICRTVELAFDSEMEYKGIDGFRNNIRKNTLDWSDEQNECYCIKMTKNIDGQAECFPSGFLDMYNCLDAPIVMSFPHFMWADQSYANTVSGMDPKEEKHMVYISMEPKTGSPLLGNKRIQFNMVMREIAKIPFTKPVKGSVMPILWVDEGVELPDKLVNDLKEKYVDKKSTIEIVKWALVAIGAVGVIMFAVMGVMFLRS